MGKIYVKFTVFMGLIYLTYKTRFSEDSESETSNIHTIGACIATGWSLINFVFKNSFLEETLTLRFQAEH